MEKPWTINGEFHRKSMGNPWIIKTEKRKCFRGTLWGPHGDPWGPMGNPWEPMGPHGSPWEPMGPHGSPWDPWGPMGTIGFPWGSMGTHDSSWGPMGPHGDPWSTTETFHFFRFYYPLISHGFPIELSMVFPWLFHSIFHGFFMDRFSMIFPRITKCFRGGCRNPSWRKKTK